MAQFPGLMLWTGDWVADTHHLSAEGIVGRAKRDTYHELLVLMWRTPGCRVPNDDAWLAKHMHMTTEVEIQLLRPIIKEFCQTDGNWIFQKRLQKEFVRAAKIQVAQSDRAKSGWKKRKRRRWGNAGPAMHTDKKEIESLLYRAREEAEPEEAAEKKASKVSAELYHLVASKRAAGEE
jgi:uncharacterized protein YdaU (DUF1376 family)